MAKLPTIEIDPGEMARIMGEMYEQIEPTRISDPGLTTLECAAEWGVSRPTARRRMVIMLEEGLLVRGERWMQKKNGHWYKVPVYRPKDEKE